MYHLEYSSLSARSKGPPHHQHLSPSRAMSRVMLRPLNLALNILVLPMSPLVLALVPIVPNPHLHRERRQERERGHVFVDSGFEEINVSGLISSLL
jgi:hypothetical protein